MSDGTAIGGGETYGSDVAGLEQAAAAATAAARATMRSMLLAAALSAIIIQPARAKVQKIVNPAEGQTNIEVERALSPPPPPPFANGWVCPVSGELAHAQHLSPTIRAVASNDIQPRRRLSIRARPRPREERKNVSVCVSERASA